MSPFTIILVALILFVLFLFAKTITVVPQQTAYIIERLGKYDRTLEAGFHILIPIADRITYKFTLKEEVINAPSQTCITKDNVGVEVDGIVYLRVDDPYKAAYGITNYRLAAMQLAQTQLRSSFGQYNLDQTFEEREHLNAHIVSAVDEAAVSWGVKVLRFEIKDIAPPTSVRASMEAQMIAERQKRAQIAQSEGHKQEAINVSEGQRQQAINLAQAEKQRKELEAEGERAKRIFEAQGEATAIESVAVATAMQIEAIAKATAAGIEMVAAALNSQGGEQAANLRVAEQMVTAYGNMAKEGTTMLIPQNMADVSSLVATAMKTFSTINLKK